MKNLRIISGNYIFTVFLITSMLYASFANAQMHTTYKRTYEAGFLPGVNWFFGDVGGNAGVGGPLLKDWVVGSFRPNISIYAAHNFNANVALRLTLAGGQMQATDGTLPPQNSGGRYFRNLSIRTDVLESSLSLQYTFRKNDYYDAAAGAKFAPYIAAGAGVVYYEPKAILNNRFIRLRPLRTEGQGMAMYPERNMYASVAFVLPVNLGFVVQLRPGLCLRSELTLRKVFTDYLDDVSTTFIDPVHFSGYLTGNDLANALKLYDRSGEINNGINLFKPGDKRGTPQNNDSWTTFSVGLTYTFFPKKYGCYRF